MSPDLDTALTLTLSIIHSLKIAQVLNNASNKKKAIQSWGNNVCQHLFTDVDTAYNMWSTHVW